MHFFQDLFCDATEASVALEVGGLEKLTEQRDQAEKNLKRAATVLEVKGKRPTHFSFVFAPRFWKNVR